MGLKELEPTPFLGPEGLLVRIQAFGVTSSIRRDATCSRKIGQ
jgi:hypothetical protein